ncbi:hypothetical protein AVEN_122445-1 [Araneus ventricosus]|uniref:Uncharacterized protein n=1 Tax=Araneus ventricosus TaxID=182803 RepID=A0A4Y2FJX8_ARAVE|nr:hypothetical protein AVEN_122445-1 [Araneus ventricosus]
MTRTTLELAPPHQTSAPHQWDQACGLYSVNKAEVKKQIVMQMLHDAPPSTSKEAVETPSVSKEGDEVSAVSKSCCITFERIKADYFIICSIE